MSLLQLQTYRCKVQSAIVLTSATQDRTVRYNRTHKGSYVMYTTQHTQMTKCPAFVRAHDWGCQRHSSDALSVMLCSVLRQPFSGFCFRSSMLCVGDWKYSLLVQKSDWCLDCSPATNLVKRKRCFLSEKSCSNPTDLCSEYTNPTDI